MTFQRLLKVAAFLALCGAIHAQPRLSQVLTPTSTVVNLSGSGMNPAALQFNITVPPGATITGSPGLAAAGKALYSYVPPIGPAVMIVIGGIGPIPDGSLATVAFAAPFTTTMSKALAADAVGGTVTISISAGPCDLNQDGVVNLADAQISIDQALGKVQGCNDFTGDGKCDVFDAQRVMNAAAGGVCKVGQ